MTMVDEKKYIPNEGNKKIYDQLFLLYKQLHDAFGTDKNGKKLNNVMKDLIKIRNQTRVGEWYEIFSYNMFISMRIWK